MYPDRFSLPLDPSVCYPNCLMPRQSTQPDKIGHDTNAVIREQELCRLALESDTYDTMSDEEWVSLCERTGKTDPVPSYSK